MRRIAIMAVSLITLLLFAGCTGNLFMQWDKPDVPSVSEINNKDVSDDSGAESFFNEIDNLLDSKVIEGDKDTSIAIVDKLKELYDPTDPDYQSGVSDETRQKAAAYAGKIAIKSDPNAEELMNNLISSLGSLTDADTNSDPAELIKNLVPESVRNDKTAFEEMINTMITAADAFLVFGENLTDIDGDGKVDSESASFMSDGEFGDTVQYAAASVAIKAAVDALDADVNVASSTDYIYNHIVNTDTPEWPTTSADPLTTIDDGTYQGMVNIFEAAGLSFS